jgi:signal transduction histidine kinase
MAGEGQASADVGDPDAPVSPTLSIEVLMTQLVDQASAVLSAQQRLQRLLDANQSIVSELSLPAVLRRVVEAARETARAEYAALGVIDSDGMLEQFVHVGMDEETVGRIGDLPKGRGLLGALIKHPASIRLGNVADDPRSSGFPAEHPPMTSFLGVPIRTRDQVYGNLYLTNRSGGGEFTAEDQELISALAATASIAIENARLYEESRQWQEWLRASAEISRQLLSNDDSNANTLRRIAISVRRLTTADVVTVVLPFHGSVDELEVVAATGMGEDELLGIRYPIADSVAWRSMREGHGLIVQDVNQRPGIHLHLRPVVPVSQVMAIPLIGESSVRGALTVGRISHQVGFSLADLDMAETFAGQAAIALELADARASQQRVAALEDHDRIARDLHDHVIQRLFAAGLSIQSLAGRIDEPSVRQRLGQTVDDLDETIRQIRNTIFALQDDNETPTVRNRVLAIVAELQPVLGFGPDVGWSGPVDTVADATVVADIEAVVRETLTNIARHAQASAVRVSVAADADRLAVEVVDDGVGLGDSTRRSGLTNLARRAERRGGTMTVDHRNEGGLGVRWTIPLR